MAPVIITAIVGALATITAAGFAAWASLKQRRVDQTVEQARLSYDAMKTLLDRYGADNLELRDRYNRDTEEYRRRLEAAESRVTDLTAQVNRCEAEKSTQAARLDAQEREIERLRKVVNGA